MLAAVETFRLDKVGADKSTLRSHLVQAWKATGRKPAQLEVGIPPQAQRVFGWFCELNQGRTSNGFGANPLSFVEISAWCSLRGVTLRPLELRLIKAIDMAFLKEMRPDHG